MKTEPKAYVQHAGKAVEANLHFKHVMALSLDPRSLSQHGLVRCIVNREGDVAKKGFIDHSELRLVTGDSLEHFMVGERLTIRKEKEVIEALLGNEPERWDFTGLEDPDIWVDPETDLLHLYFTMPFAPRHKTPMLHHRINLGHAVGSALDSLEMTAPVLECDTRNWLGAKEVSIAPKNAAGVRLNLIESSAREEGMNYSVVRVAIAENMGKSWQFGEPCVSSRQTQSRLD